jgi:hypothetical protein
LFQLTDLACDNPTVIADDFVMVSGGAPRRLQSFFVLCGVM